MDEYKFLVGGMWEDAGFSIVTDEEVHPGKPCPHCHSERLKDRGLRSNGEPMPEYRVWTCPRVLVAVNESGYNSTGVCLDCVLEASASMPHTRS